jgi:SAM-dependent methyltransferase
LFDGGTRCRFTPRSQLLRATALSAQVADLSAPLNFEADAFGTCSCVGTLTYLEPASGVLAEFVRVVRPGGLICFTHRTDKIDVWRPEQARLVETGAWALVHESEPLAYLPNHPEYGDSIRRVDSIYRVC